ncbi:MAG TPA: DUF4296 domain-containing protein [Bacteroidia bacterium]|nr:DUF4296 domain-containing protein [Bacteroidia bacterium]
MNIPKEYLTRDTMIEVITDVHLVQASQRLNIPIDTADTGTATSFNYVWKKHHITEVEYKRSLDFYSHNPSILDTIYEKVLNNLSQEKAELMGKKNIKKL